jgi:hypothetical protein
LDTPASVRRTDDSACGRTCSSADGDGRKPSSSDDRTQAKDREQAETGGTARGAAETGANTRTLPGAFARSSTPSPSRIADPYDLMPKRTGSRELTNETPQVRN